MTDSFIRAVSAAASTASPLLLDGGLGTALEDRGIDLGHELWSADLLRNSPDTLAEVHADFARAGARVLTTASYQATPLGFSRAGISPAEGAELIAASVALARTGAERARSAAASPGDAAPAIGASAPATGAEAGAPDPTVHIAGSVGPYGAALGTGAEYTGDYRLSPEEYARFHRPRIAALVAAGADALAIETQPRLDEIRVLIALAAEHGIPAWVTVTLAPGTQARSQADPRGGHRPAPETVPVLPDGSPLSALAEAVAGNASVCALGVNCVPPALVGPALEALARHTELPLIAYPNAGGRYDAATMRWHDEPAAGPAGVDVERWLAAWVRLLGGCCRTTPEHIAGLRRRLSRD